MKRIIALLLIVYCQLPIEVKAQTITDTAALRTAIDTDIVPNAAGGITAAKLNRILLGTLNSLSKVGVTSFYRRTDSVFYVKDGTETFAFIDSVGAGGGNNEGIQYYGQIYNDSLWTAPDFAADFIQAGGITASDSSGHIKISGGASDWTQTLNINVDQAHNITPYYTNLTNWRMVVKARIITTGAFGIGIKSTTVNNLSNNAIGYINTATGASSLSAAGTVLATSATNLTSSPGDYIQMIVERNGFLFSISVRNITTNSATITTNSSFTLPTGGVPPPTGQYAIFSYSGQTNIDSISISSQAIKNADLVLTGTSKTVGKNATTLTGYSVLLANNYQLVVRGGITETTQEWESTIKEVMALAPKQVIFENPCNDLRFGINADSTKNRMYRMSNTLRNAGIKVYWLDAIYETSSSPAAWLSYVNANISADSVINVYYPTAISGALDVDNIHPTIFGQSIIYKTILNSDKLTPSLNTALSPNNFILNQNAATQLGGAFDIDQASRIKNSLEVGPHTSGLIDLTVRTASNNNWKFYNTGGLNKLSSLNDANTVFTAADMQALSWNIYANSISSIVISTAGAVRFPTYGAGTAIFDASGNITSNTTTGTGSSVRAISPTFTGTIGAAAITSTGVIGVGGAAAASAKLDVQSTTQGFLLPRMTTAQRDAIASPATWLTLICTDCTATDASTGVMQTWNGSAWKNAW